MFMWIIWTLCVSKTWHRFWQDVVIYGLKDFLLQFMTEIALGGFSCSSAYRIWSWEDRREVNRGVYVCTHASSARCYCSSRHCQGRIRNSLEVLSFPGHPKEMEVCAPLLFSPQGFLIGLLLLWLLGLPQTSAFSMDNFGFKDSHEI